MSVLQTTYTVCKAHVGTLGKQSLKTERMETVRKFLQRKADPFDWDVNIYNLILGNEWEIYTVTGEQFLEDTDPNN